LDLKRIYKNSRCLSVKGLEKVFPIYFSKRDSTEKFHGLMDRVIYDLDQLNLTGIQTSNQGRKSRDEHDRKKLPGWRWCGIGLGGAMTGTSPEQGEMRSGGQISMGIGSKRSVGGGQPVLLTLRGQ
jgi:hypothetical protein